MLPIQEYKNIWNIKNTQLSYMKNELNILNKQITFYQVMATNLQCTDYRPVGTDLKRSIREKLIFMQ